MTTPFESGLEGLLARVREMPLHSHIEADVAELVRDAAALGLRTAYEFGPTPETEPNEYQKRILADQAKPQPFGKKLASLINSVSRENASDTPDFILAEFLEGCLAVFETTTRTRDRWWGGKVPLLNDAQEREVSPGEPPLAELFTEFVVSRPSAEDGGEIHLPTAPIAPPLEWFSTSDGILRAFVRQMKDNPGDHVSLDQICGAAVRLLYSPPDGEVFNGQPDPPPLAAVLTLADVQEAIAKLKENNRLAGDEEGYVTMTGTAAMTLINRLEAAENELRALGDVAWKPSVD